ncbi:MAG: hypothetical protein RML15_04300 [Bacteroidota bacterium]|nr:hypothetical protein [Candidatus Kapabacteria bacterium]MCX7936128.1 hypothetical protein [Chlorobiota bacterium]MDW8074978.1 hypothetical protein [Bacteroidota bacterium]MDW8271617.1 hypothetical protein [Bacteroidota bacterium]
MARYILVVFAIATVVAGFSMYVVGFVRRMYQKRGIHSIAKGSTSGKIGRSPRA